MQRRDFLRGGAAVAALAAGGAGAEGAADAPVFSTRNAAWQKTYDDALKVLAGNVQMLPRFDGPVLIEGAEYAGMWLECGPLEGLIYRRWSPVAAANNHLTFFALQRPDGQFPSNNKRTEAGFGQIQMVVPIAATAWELAEATGNDELLHKAYDACERWDAWLVKYRNTRGTGLCEGFCTYDTGHDNSPRWKGVPNRCPDSDARKWPEGVGVPRLCPDLSATVYGGRVALAKMARALGRAPQEARWQEKAEAIRALIVAKLYDEKDVAFYDLDIDDKFVRVRGDVLSRVCGEHVVTQDLFERLWAGQLHKKSAFWAPYPLPSIAMDDPAFVRPIPRNSWGGASQALTSLRAPRWMEFYGKTAELGQMMQAWCDALVRDGTFRQQLDPMTGEFTDGGSKGYSPAALVLVDYTWRLAGIREDGGRIEWTVRPGCAAADGARFQMKTNAGLVVEMRYDKVGAELRLAGKKIARVDGNGRLVTDLYGTGIELVGIVEGEQTVTVTGASKGGRTVTVGGNERVKVRG